MNTINTVICRRLSTNGFWVITKKRPGCLTCLYDKYGNRIDGNSYYEYDNTGQWVCRTNRDHPKEVERIQYIYK